MINLLRSGVLVMAFGLFLAACAVPLDVSVKTGLEAGSAPRSSPGGLEELISGLNFKVSGSYMTAPPKCVAILPLNKAPLSKEEGESAGPSGITFDQTEVVRRVLYAHLSPHGKRDVEIPRVDHVLGGMEDGARDDYSLIGRKLNCDALITGEVTEYGARFMGIYSRVAVAANLKMIRAETGEVLWRGSYESTSNGGSVPMSLIGVAKGIYSAAMNVREKSLLMVLDNLGRTLVSSIPDNRIAVLEEPLAPFMVAGRGAGRTDTGATARLAKFFAGLSGKPPAKRKAALIAATRSGRFKDGDMRRLHLELIDTAPRDANSHGAYARYLVNEGDYAGALGFTYNALALNGKDSAMHFLKGRIQIKLADLDGADASIIEAVALDRSNAGYAGGLGYLNSLRGKDDRALAAYQMALDLDPDNGFSHYNMGVIYYNAGNLLASRDSFYRAGLAYLKKGDYGQAQKTVTDLRELAAKGVSIDNELDSLERSLAALREKNLKNA